MNKTKWKKIKVASLSTLALSSIVIVPIVAVVSCSSETAAHQKTKIIENALNQINTLEPIKSIEGIPSNSVTNSNLGEFFTAPKSIDGVNFNLSLVGDYFGFGTLNITLTGELNGTSWSKIVIVEGFQTTNPEKLFNLSSEGFYPTTLGDALGTKSLPLVGEETNKLKTEKSIPDNITNYGELKNYISIHNQDVNSSTKVYVSQITNDIQNINLGVLGSFEYNTKTNALTYSYFQINTISQLSEYFQDLKSILPKELFELKNPQDLYIWFSKPNGINTLIGGDGVGPDYLTNKIHQYIYLSIKYSTFRAGALIGTYNTNTGSWTWTYSPLYTQLNPNILPGVHIGPNGLPTTISNFGELAEYLNLSVFTQPFAEFYIKKDFKLVVDAVKNNTQWITVQTQELKLNLGEGKSQVFPVPIPVSIEGKFANGTWTYTIISTEKS